MSGLVQLNNLFQVGRQQESDGNAKPSILEVISRYVSLRRSGKEYLGLCPFHPDKNPSFSVNDEKGLFHCFGCGESGDTISFIQKIENLTFKEALAFLGLNDQPRPKPNRAEREANETITAWALNTSHQISARLRDLGQRLHTAQKVMREPWQIRNFYRSGSWNGKGSGKSFATYRMT